MAAPHQLPLRHRHSVSFVGNVHEVPTLLNGRNTTVFQPALIITDEPGVTRPVRWASALRTS
ncbi:MAG: hypothetical protein ACLVJH_04495 [Faecalibacterium prausnitzii]